MIESMTGYGSATRSSSNFNITIELKSLNSKYLEVMLKLPRVYLKYEHKMRNYLTKELKRGKVVVLLNVEVLSPEKRTLNINKGLANKYKTELEELGEHLGIENQVDFAFLLGLPEVIPTEIDHEDPEEWKLLEEATALACEELTRNRIEEGKALDEDMGKRVIAIREALEEVKKLAPVRIENIRNRLDQSMEDIKHKVEVDKNRFEQELIYYLEKYDINEEIVRLSQHLEFFVEMLAGEISNGKQLNFIAQEMGREINTIGSKANNAQIQRLVVGMKNELEKIKEQVLNVV